MLVKMLGRFVLGVNQHREHTKLSARGALQCVRQENAPKPPALVMTRDGKPPQQNRGHHWIPGKFLRDLGRQRIQGYTGGCERIVGRYLGYSDVDGHETRRDAPPYVLRCLLPKILVKRIRTAKKSRPVMIRR